MIILKTPSFDDLFFIHWQSRMEAKWSVILIIVFLIKNITKSVYDQLTLSHTLIFSGTSIFTLFALLFVSTFMIKYKNELQENKLKIQRMTVGTDTPDTEIHVI